MTRVKAIAGDRFGYGFCRYDPDAFDFLPLHLWNARKCFADGTVKLLGKAPIAARWTTVQVNSRAVRRRCRAEKRNMGVRLKPTHLVIDIDPRAGGDESFLVFCCEVGLDPDVWPCVITGSGGRHYYLMLPDGFALQETFDNFPGLEFKSVGRQVVAAGSRHPNGELYRWSPDHPDIREGVPMAPRALLRAIKQADRGGNGGGDGGQFTVEQLARALSRLDVLDFRDESKWRRLMFACHHATNGDGERLFVDWSAGDPQFAGASGDVRTRWRSCRSKATAITYKTLNHILREHDAADAQVAEDVPLDEFPDDDLTMEADGVPDDAFIIHGEAPSTFEIEGD